MADILALEELEAENEAKKKNTFKGNKCELPNPLTNQNQLFVSRSTTNFIPLR